MKKIIGIVGPIGSGKDTAGEYLAQKYNLKIYVISDVIREFLSEHNIEPTRANLIKHGDLMSKENEAYLAEALLKKAEDPSIFLGMRIPKQISYLKENSDFFLIAIDTPVEVRFKRAQERRKLGEAHTLAEFIAVETAENSLPNIKDVFACMKEADILINNNGTLKELYDKLDAISLTNI
jgi:dephospho-CoA kinase